MEGSGSRRAGVDLLALDQWEAQKNRLRKLTDGGTELALSLDRSIQLHDGDVLHWDEATATAIVARIALSEVMVVDLRGLAGAEPDGAGADRGRARPRARQPALAGRGEGRRASTCR